MHWHKKTVSTGDLPWPATCEWGYRSSKHPSSPPQSSNALATLLVLRVFMGGADCLPKSDIKSQLLRLQIKNSWCTPFTLESLGPCVAHLTSATASNASPQVWCLRGGGERIVSAAGPHAIQPPSTSNSAPHWLPPTAWRATEQRYHSSVKKKGIRMSYSLLKHFRLSLQTAT